MIAAGPSQRECDVEDIVSDLRQQAGEMIRENPGLSMLVVFGVGIAVGAVLSEVVGHCLAQEESTMQRMGRRAYNAVGMRY